MSKEILQVNQVTARVEDKEILHGVSLDIKKGETHVLMGPYSDISAKGMRSTGMRELV